MINIYKDIQIGESKLQSGEINISGYKHAAVQLIAASIIHPHPVTINHVPAILDTLVLAEIILECGGKACLEGKTLFIDADGLQRSEVPPHLSQQIHGSLYLLPAFLARLSRVKFFKAGGCQIGSDSEKGQRPVDHMLSVMERFGAVFTKEDEWIIGQCNRLVPTTIDILDYSDNRSVPNGPLVSGATKTAILCAMGCKAGTTRILNPYMKPDVLELLRFLDQSGYGVKYSPQEIVITVPTGTIPCTYDLISDISEIITFITLSVHAGIPLRLTDVTTRRAREGLRAELELLDRMGIPVEWEETAVRVKPVQGIKPQHIRVTSTGIFSDHHPFFTLMLLQAEGTSRIEEHVWKDRFHYVEGLRHLGAKLTRVGSMVKIEPSLLSQPGEPLVASELRGAAVLILASLTIPGTTIVKNVDHISRGYENFFEKLRQLGAQIEPIHPVPFPRGTEC